MFNVEKAIILTQKIILSCGTRKTINWMELLPLVYCCDRKMLKSYDRFITNDTIRAWKYGPFPEKLRACIEKAEESKNLAQYNMSLDSTENTWNRYFETNGSTLVLKEEFDSNLEKEEEEVVACIIKDFGHWEYERILRYCYENFPELKKPMDTGISILISKEDILNAES